MAKLAYDLHIEPPTLSRMVSRLEEARLVDKEKDSYDQRTYNVYLTSMGRIMKRYVEHAWTEVDEKLQHHFTSGEREEFRRLLKLARRNLG